MASRSYNNPWARGVSELTNAYMAREQGLAAQAAAQREAEIEAQRWAAEHGLDVQRTNSALARDQSTIGLNDTKDYRIRALLPHEVENLGARTAASRASAASSLASARYSDAGTRLRGQEYDHNAQMNPLLVDKAESDARIQELAALAADNNMNATGGRSPEVPNPGQARVMASDEIVQLGNLARQMQQQLEQTEPGTPARAEIEANLDVLEQSLGGAQQRYGMVTDMGESTLLARRANAALTKLEEAGGDESVLTPVEQRDIETFYASRPQTDAAVASLTESQQGAKIDNLSTIQNAAMNLDDAMNQTLELIDRGGDKLTGIPASLIRMTDSLRGAVTGISDLTGLIDQEDANYLDRITSGLTDNASDAKSLRALLSDVAIMNYRLKNPNDPRMSDFDLRVQLQPLESGSARSIRGFIVDAQNRIPQFYENAVRSAQNTGIDVPEGLRTVGRPAPAPAAAPAGGDLAPDDEALLNKYLN